jgi:hypothetical protein
METLNSWKEQRENQAQIIAEAQGTQHTREASTSRISKSKHHYQTNFLSLPLELRQSILYLTWDNLQFQNLLNDHRAAQLIPQDRLLGVEGMISRLDANVRNLDWSCLRMTQGQKLLLWAKNLRCVHIQIADDIDYVKRKWKEDGERLNREWESLR